MAKDDKVIKKYGKLADAIYFVIAAGGRTKYTSFYLEDKKFDKIKSLLLCSDSEIGIHSSFECGNKPELIEKEKKNLEKLVNRKVTCNKNHYLLSKKPNDMNYLIQSGITDDYTMGYAEQIGFRLGTSRAVKWIDSNKKVLTSLVLHPLSIMDCTLYSKKYMNLNHKQALTCCKKLIKQIYKYNGEVVLLWHNNVFEVSQCNWIKSIYCEIIDFICAIDSKK